MLIQDTTIFYTTQYLGLSEQRRMKNFKIVYYKKANYHYNKAGVILEQPYLLVLRHRQATCLGG